MGWTAAAPPQPLEGGWDNHLWRFSTADGRSHVLRMYRGYGPVATAKAANEAAAMECARHAGLAVPANEAVGDVDGVPVFIQQLMPGVPVVDAVKRRPWQLASLARQFGAMQARIHSIPPPSTVRRLGVGEIRTTIDDGPLAEALAREARIDTFCHLDYHPLNVLACGGTLTAVLDWPGAAVTDRRADLAFTETALLRIPLPPSPINALLNRVRRRLHHHWREGYRAEAGEFPLSPLFQAASVVSYISDLEAAVREGRGWATEADVITMRSEQQRLMKAAGLMRMGPPPP